jgi:hypothetical protein
VIAGPLLAAAAVVAAVLLLGLACDVVRLRRVKRGAVPLGSVPVRGARIGLSSTVATPTAIGYLHPAVVLPQGFRARVDDREWDAVVAHECAHLARGDDWAKAVQSAILRVGWWIPGLWVLSRALDLERELASDERAACETGPRRYAACLLRLATDRADALAPGLWARRSHVAIRVERLVRPVPQAGPAVRAAALGAFTAAAFAVVAGAVLAVPGTGVPVAVVAPPMRAHPAVARAAAARAHVARVASHSRHLKPAAHAKTLAYAVPVAAPPLPVAAPAAAAERPAPTEHIVAHIIATVAEPAGARARVEAPAHREPGRPIPAIRPDLGPTETLAFVAPHRKCRTCFGPLRSPDDAEQTFASAAKPASKAPAAGGTGTTAAIVADDPTSGPVDLGSGLIWYRLPARIQGP